MATAIMRTMARRKGRSIVGGECRGLRYGVEAAPVEGMTAQDPPRAEPAAAQYPVAADRFQCVLRAARREAAPRRHRRREHPLVAADHDHRGPARPELETGHRIT